MHSGFAVFHSGSAVFLSGFAVFHSRFAVFRSGFGVFRSGFGVFPNGFGVFLHRFASSHTEVRVSFERSVASPKRPADLANRLGASLGGRGVAYAAFR